MARYRTFWQDYFHAPICYEAETKFCVAVSKSVCVHAHVQRKRLTASKFGTKILERFLRRPRNNFLKIDLDFLE